MYTASLEDTARNVKIKKKSIQDKRIYFLSSGIWARYPLQVLTVSQARLRAFRFYTPLRVVCREEGFIGRYRARRHPLRE
jgi:hypothetical protein